MLEKKAGLLCIELEEHKNDELIFCILINPKYTMIITSFSKYRLQTAYFFSHLLCNRHEQFYYKSVTTTKQNPDSSSFAEKSHFAR